MEAPSTNIQAPEKLQAPMTQVEGAVLHMNRRLAALERRVLALEKGNGAHGVTRPTLAGPTWWQLAPAERVRKIQEMVARGFGVSREKLLQVADKGEAVSWYKLVALFLAYADNPNLGKRWLSEQFGQCSTWAHARLRDSKIRLSEDAEAKAEMEMWMGKLERLRGEELRVESRNGEARRAA